MLSVTTDASPLPSKPTRSIDVDRGPGIRAMDRIRPVFVLGVGFRVPPNSGCPSALRISPCSLPATALRLNKHKRQVNAEFGGYQKCASLDEASPES